MKAILHFLTFLTAVCVLWNGHVAEEETSRAMTTNMFSANIADVTMYRGVICMYTVDPLCAFTMICEQFCSPYAITFHVFVFPRINCVWALVEKSLNKNVWEKACWRFLLFCALSGTSQRLAIGHSLKYNQAFNDWSIIHLRQLQGWSSFLNNNTFSLNAEALCDH